MKNIEHSINHQLDAIKARYKKEIGQIAALRDKKKEFYDLLYQLADAGMNLKGTNLLLPFYYILTKDYHMAWVLLNYLNLKFAYYQEEYHAQAKLELENPVTWDMKPLWNRDHEERIMPLRQGSTCFRLATDYVPKALEDLHSGAVGKVPFDLSPEARYVKADGVKNFFLSYDSLYRAMRLLEIYFRQERLEETEELLFRLRHIVSQGEPPKRLIEHLKARQASAWVNMYDCWYQGRHQSDPVRRKTLGWMALYWWLELGLGLLDDSNIDEFVKFSDGCEIIGEFVLMGEDQENFLRHLKRFVMHASVSFCRKMMADPIQLIPFSERNMPGYEEYQAFYKKRAGLE